MPPKPQRENASYPSAGTRTNSLLRLRVISQQELENVIERHEQWKAGEPGSDPPDLSLCDLRAVRFPEHVNLGGISFAGSDLQNQNLRGAELSDSDLRWTNLRGTDLTGSNLSYAKLTGAKNLLYHQLAGTNLSGAEIADRNSMFDLVLKKADEASGTLGKLNLSLLVALLTVVLYAGSASDVTLLENLPAKGLPFGSVEVGYLALSILVPGSLLLIQLYLLVRYQVLRLLIAKLPAVFVYGLRIDEVGFQWTGIGFLRNASNPAWANREAVWSLQQAGDSFLVWWSVPVTLTVIWARCLICHNWYLTFLQSAVLTLSLLLSIAFRQLVLTASETVQPQQRVFHPAVPLWARSVVVGFICFALLAAASYALMFTRLGVGANVRDAELSHAPLGKTRFELNHGPVALLQEVLPAKFADRDLRNCNAAGAFLVNADLRYANLTRCYFS
jgi:uncharacterized protein YjbI with pentapeptide repeats